MVPLQDEERQAWASLPFNEKQYRKDFGVPKLFGETGYTTLERTWARPTFEVNGLLSGFTGEGAKTVLPALAMAKVSMRLVPNQDPDKIATLFEDYVRKIAPKTVELKVTRMHGGKPWMTSYDNPFVQAAGRAIEKGFGRKPVFTREGGSIPVVSTFQEELGLPSVLFGVGLPDENAHAPNEKLDVGNFHNGIIASAILYEEIASISARERAAARGTPESFSARSTACCRDRPEIRSRCSSGNHVRPLHAAEARCGAGGAEENPRADAGRHVAGAAETAGSGGRPGRTVLESRLLALRKGIDHFRRAPNLAQSIRGPVKPALRALKGLAQMSGDGGAYRMLLFAADHPVLPVDARLSRVARRLGYGDREEYRRGRRRRARFARRYRATCRWTPTSTAALSLYLSHHGGATCTEAEPHCRVCPLRASARHFRIQISECRFSSDC